MSTKSKQRKGWRAFAVAGFLDKPILPRRMAGIDNYAIADDSGRCKFWDGRSTYGNIKIECRNCIRRPLYTAECFFGRGKNAEAGGSTCVKK